MFGKRSAPPGPPVTLPAPPLSPSSPPQIPTVAHHDEAAPAAAPAGGNETYYGVKTKVFEALLDTVDLTQLGRLDAGAKRDELTDICREIVAVKGFVLSPSKEEELISGTSATMCWGWVRWSRCWTATISRTSW